MRPSWRFMYSFTTQSLIETLREMRKGTYKALYFMDTRETYLQARDAGLIKLPDNIQDCDAHLIPFSIVTILNDSINLDGNSQNTH